LSPSPSGPPRNSMAALLEETYGSEAMTSEDGMQKRAGKSALPPSPSAKKRMEANEPYFLNQLEQMRTCLGNDRVEHDFAKNTENHLVVIRSDNDKARAASQTIDRETVQCRNSMQEHCFERLMGDFLGNRACRDHREASSRPAHIPKDEKAAARHQIVMENQCTQMKAQVDYRVNYIKEKMDTQHARTERLADQYVKKKMEYAQQTMMERLRWRANHHEHVTVKGQRYEAEKIKLFAQREAHFQKRQAVADNRSSLRQELYRLRHTNREMNEELRNRKHAYEKRMKNQETDDWKASINAAALSLSPAKMKSNLSSSYAMSPASLTASRKSVSAPSLAMSRSVPTHMGSPMAHSTKRPTAVLFPSWCRHG